MAKMNSVDYMKMEAEYAAHNYHPMPCVFTKAEGVFVYDPEGRRYYDFLSAYSAVNQGHCHPKIVEAMIAQSHTCTLSSRAFYNDIFPRYAKFVTEMTGYEMVLPMNTGAEAVETGFKLAHKWGYQKKKVPENEALFICCNGCFHGRTMLAISMSDDPSSYAEFGPFLPGLIRIDYDDAEALEKVLKEKGDKVVGFIVEPIQGEAGIKVPHPGYLQRVAELCKQYNVLLICDEIQTGLSRTGRLLCQEHDGIRGDITLLGKALSGGVYPVSAVLSSKEIMLCIRPGEHGSTYGGNPVAAAVGIAALSVLKEEKLTERAEHMGKRLMAGLEAVKAGCPFIRDVRGRGLLCAIELKEDSPLSAWEICQLLMESGMLCKPTHDTTIRLAPPLVITEEQIDECVGFIKEAVSKIGKVSKEQIPNREAALHH